MASSRRGSPAASRTRHENEDQLHARMAPAFLLFLTASNTYVHTPSVHARMDRSAEMSAPQAVPSTIDAAVYLARRRSIRQAVLNPSTPEDVAPAAGIDIDAHTYLARRRVGSQPSEPSARFAS